MTRYTVQCGYAAYSANTVVVEAATLDAAVDAAIALANDDPRWRPLDACGPTFVDAVAEGADADPWDGYASALPVPARFTEGGAPPAVTVVLRDGAPPEITVTGGRVEVVVHDRRAPTDAHPHSGSPGPARR